MARSDRSDSESSVSSAKSDASDGEFETPEGFDRVKVDTPAFSVEDLRSDDKELWFIRVPYDMDASSLEGVKMKLPKKDRPGKAICKIELENSNTYELKTADVDECSQIVNLFPNEDGKNYVLGKPFSRAFSMVRTFNVPVETESPTNAAAVDSSEKVVKAMKKLKKEKKNRKHSDRDDTGSSKKKKRKKTKMEIDA